MRIKIVPTMRYNGDVVNFDTFRIEGSSIFQRDIWVSADEREKEVLKEGDVWIKGAKESVSEENAACNLFKEMLLHVELLSGKAKLIYVTGACNVYELNENGKTIDKL